MVEGVIPTTPETLFDATSICQTDMLMLSLSPGGKERTQQEFQSLAIGAGFKDIRLECFTCQFWVMEFYK